MIDISNIELAKKEIKKSKSAKIIVRAQDDVFNRKILEYGKFNVLLGIESGVRKNSIRQVDSGLNHVLANIARKNHVSLGIDVRELSKLSKKEKAITLTKIKQNIKICRKAKTKFLILNYSEKRNAQDLLLSLGASTIQVKQAVSF